MIDYVHWFVKNAWEVQNPHWCRSANHKKQCLVHVVHPSDVLHDPDVLVLHGSVLLDDLCNRIWYLCPDQMGCPEIQKMTDDTCFPYFLIFMAYMKF